MFSALSGTLVNVVTVLIGSSVGLLLGARLPDRYQRIILDALGLVTITLGIDAAVIVMGDTIARYRPAGPEGQTYGARLAMVMVGSLAVGATIGTALRLHARLEGLGQVIHRRLRPRGGPAAGDLASPGGRFAEGFLTASVIFCVGPLTLLGCLNNGAHGDPSLLYVKAFLDGFCSMALAASIGAGVMCSVVTILVFQGGLALLAWTIAGGIPDLSLQMMNVVGGVILLATALMILEIRKIPVADMLPALFLPPVIIAAVQHVWPGAL